MNIGLYQSASALSALERWQESVAQNITSSQTTAFRKRTVSFSADAAGEIQTDHGRADTTGGTPALFPTAASGINFRPGETQPTRRELDVAIQSDGFFAVQRSDGSRAYTRAGEFQVRADRTLVTRSGDEVLTDGGAPITLLANGGALVVNADGTLFQGETSLGRLGVTTFSDPRRLTAIADGYFIAPPGVAGEPAEAPGLLQGYLEASNVNPLREMVDLVVISRAYEANQKIVSSADQQMEKALDALG